MTVLQIIFGVMLIAMMFVLVLKDETLSCRDVSIVFERLSEHAVLPTKAHDCDAGWDLYASEDIVIRPHSSAKVATDIAWEPSTDWCYMQIKCRSGMAFKDGVELTSAGVIDSSYRGAIGLKLFNTTDEPIDILRGDRVAQGVVLPIPRTKAVEGSVLKNTKRGTKGFGSSGK